MVTANTLLRDTIFFIKNDLKTNLTDPLTSRPANQQYILTSYPQRETTYPIITIKDTNISASNLGLQSQAQLVPIGIEIRCWARNVKEKDEMFEDVWDRLRNNQIGPAGTSQANDLHDFKIISTTNLDEENGPKSKIIQIKYLFVAP